MSKGLGKVEKAIIESFDGWRHRPKDYCLGFARTKLGLDDTPSSRATLSRALHTLFKKGIINTYDWYWERDNGRLKRVINLRLAKRERKEKSPEEILSKAERNILDGLCAIGHLRADNKLTQEMLRSLTLSIYTWEDSVKELVNLLEQVHAGSKAVANQDNSL